MQTLTPIEWQVLRLTAVVPENLEQIHDQLRNLPGKAPLADAADAVRSLVEKGILTPKATENEQVDEVSRIWKATFEPTTEGREALTESRPGPPPGWPEGRIYPGMFAGMMSEISTVEIDEARRQMWENAPKDGDSPRDPERTSPVKRRSLLGIFAGRIPDIPFEVFKENRREMSRKYSEESFDE